MITIRIISLFNACALCFSSIPSLSVLKAESTEIKYEYGVFLGADPDDIPEMESYKKVVIDAQAFTDSEIKGLKDNGHIVYSYINLGSVEELLILLILIFLERYVLLNISRVVL